MELPPTPPISNRVNTAKANIDVYVCILLQNNRKPHKNQQKRFYGTIKMHQQLIKDHPSEQERIFSPDETTGLTKKQ